ncbi:unnamed protein product [Pocillopora meandrina]|uniref:Uncharacterized protein n=1 Tax=Pocillopora meandrina TaxID=46732 RepID=A0AAU9XUP0_9CNID|nr:unnamed protein product [Pocillopora meandrina]
MLGQSSSSIEDQIKFVPARHDDLVNLTQKVKTKEDVEVEDEMRFMNGDNPATNFECGNQHGGHYGCPGCDGHLSMCHDLDYMAQRKYRTLTEWQQLVLAGRKGKEAKQLLNPFKDLKSVSVESLNLQSYEVLCFEALHCSMNHIKNILEEIPHHISDIDTLIKLKEILAVQLNKEKKRGVDYHKTLIYLTIALYQTTTHDVRALLATLCEMVEIFYAQDRKRSPKLILRLHNLCWRHAILC